MDESDAGRENVGVVCQVVGKIRIRSYTYEPSRLDRSEQRSKIVTANDDLPVSDLDTNYARIVVAPMSRTIV
jgi:hypothetical protein